MNADTSQHPPRRRAPRRRTQVERSDAMRRRLIDATLDCLAEDGYAGTTISRIAQRAGVSHGATGHHFASKADLIVAAANELVRRRYRIMGELVLGIADEKDRLHALAEGSWERIYSHALMHAYFELTLASHRDPALAAALRQLMQRAREMFDVAIDHYFEPAPGSAERPRLLFLELDSLLLGLAAQAHLTEDDCSAREQLRAWVRTVSGHLRARRGVRGPPPRPSGWD